jgi:hypothetical protein
MLSQWQQDHKPQVSAEEITTDVDDSVKEALKALGYVD